MKLKMLLSIAIFLLTFLVVYPSDNQFLKLKKVAVSSLPEDLIVPVLKSLTIDHKGNVFAFAGKSNGKECFVVKFDENLKYLKRFGRDGKGPGEFSTKFSTPENRLSVDINDDVYVVDSNPCKLVIFDNEGNHKKDIPIARDYLKSIGKLSRLKIVGNGTFIALQPRRELPPHALIFTLNPPQIKVRYPFIEKRTYDNYVSSYYGEICIIDTESEYIIFGNSQIYNFHVYDRNGKLKLKVEDKDKVMGSFNAREMEYIKDNFFTPKSGYSFIRNSILTQLNADRSKFKKLMNQIMKSKNIIADIKMSGERIYVFPVRKDITVKGKFPVEIYNLKGQVVKRGYFHMRPAKIWKNYVFFYDRNEEDDPLILKYKILDHY